MGRTAKSYYSAELMSLKQKYYEGLPEQQARHFLGQEYLTLGPGSQRYLAKVFGCSRQTIKKGVEQLNSADFTADYSRQR